MQEIVALISVSFGLSIWARMLYKFATQKYVGSKVEEVYEPRISRGHPLTNIFKDNV